jgi:hypothetical protein
MMEPTPGPARDIAAEEARAFVERRRQSLGEERIAPARRFLAEPVVRLLEKRKQRLVVAGDEEVAQDGIGCETIEQRTLQMFRPPDLEERGGGAVAAEAVVPGLEQVECRRKIAALPVEPAEKRRQAARRDRQIVALQRQRLRQRVVGIRGEHLRDPCRPRMLRPFEARLALGIRIVGRQVHLIGAGDEAARRIDLARQVLGRKKPVPFITPVARYRQQPVPVRPARRPADGDPGDVAGNIGIDLID